MPSIDETLNDFRPRSDNPFDEYGSNMEEAFAETFRKELQAIIAEVRELIKEVQNRSQNLLSLSTDQQESIKKM